MGSDAAWRHDRKTHTQLLQTLLDNGVAISPLLTLVPWIQNDCFRIDWLHCADQGVAADFIANLFLLVIRKLPGATERDRCAALWARLFAWYEANGIGDQLQTLVLSMLRQGRNPPKLRCSAAQCRALVPFALKVATDILDPADDIEATAIQAMRHLSECYKALGDSSPSFSAKLKENSTKFALLYCALEATDPTGVRWRVKPKLHMFLELCSEGSMPARFWNYRDEDFGGSVSKLSRRRGGVLSQKAFSSNLLERFKIAQPIIRMLL